MSDALLTPIVGILGGMGPAATADFLTKLVAATPARSDQDHLRVLLWSDPRVPDRSAALLHDGPDPTAWLLRGARRLADGGAELIAVPCNTAHAYLDPLVADTDLELVSIIDAAADAAVDRGWRRPGILATAGTVRAGLHQDALSVRGLESLVPSAEEQQQVDAVIAAVKAGRAGAAEESALVEVGVRLRERGADGLLSACTELVFVLDRTDPPLPVVDPADELAQLVVARASERMGQ